MRKKCNKIDCQRNYGDHTIWVEDIFMIFIIVEFYLLFPCEFACF